jgi:hypothetical protein
MKNPYKTQTYRPILGQASTKTIKGEKIGFLTGIVYLVPSIKLCPFSELAGCLKPCLSTAGRGAFDSVQRARQAKTDFFTPGKLTSCAHLRQISGRSSAKPRALG